MKYSGIYLVAVFFVSIFSVVAEDANFNNIGKLYEQLGLVQDLSYSGQMIVDGPDVKGAVFQMFYKGGNIRTEGEQSGMKFTMIVRKDSTIYSYNDVEKKWSKTSMNGLLENSAKMPEYKKTADEEVNGRMCARFEAVDTATGIKNVVWVSEGIIYKYLILAPAGQEQVVTYRNIEKKDLSESIFLPPAGEEVKDMTEMLKAIMAQQGSQNTK